MYNELTHSFLQNVGNEGVGPVAPARAHHVLGVDGVVLGQHHDVALQEATVLPHVLHLLVVPVLQFLSYKNSLSVVCFKNWKIKSYKLPCGRSRRRSTSRGGSAARSIGPWRPSKSRRRRERRGACWLSRSLLTTKLDKNCHHFLQNCRAELTKNHLRWFPH